MLTAATATNTLTSIIMVECKINTLFTHGHVHKAPNKASDREEIQ